MHHIRLRKAEGKSDFLRCRTDEEVAYKNQSQLVNTALDHSILKRLQESRLLKNTKNVHLKLYHQRVSVP